MSLKWKSIGELYMQYNSTWYTIYNDINLKVRRKYDENVINKGPPNCCFSLQDDKLRETLSNELDKIKTYINKKCFVA